MKYYRVFLILFLLFSTSLYAQHTALDSLHARLVGAKADSDKVNALLDLGNYYYFSLPDSAIIFGQKAYELADKRTYVDKKLSALNMLANAYAEMGDYANSFRYYRRALQAYSVKNDLYGMGKENNNMGDTYRQEGDYLKALQHLRIANEQTHRLLATHKSTPLNNSLRDIVIGNIGEVFLALHQIDSAARYLTIAAKLDQQDHLPDLLGPSKRDIGEVEAARHHKNEALAHFREAIRLENSVGDGDGMSIAYLSMSSLYHQFKMQDSAEYYAEKSLTTATKGKYEQDVLSAGQTLYRYYDEDHNIPKAFQYFKMATAARDSIYSQDRIKQLLNLDFEDRRRQDDIKNAQLQYQYQVRVYVILAGLIIALIIMFIIWRNARQRKAANHLLLRQKLEIEQTLLQLKAAQSQLVQAEKMASLGELTAGIAHEIQNPLNFVNNFSEVSTELIAELKQELDEGHPTEARAIAGDIEQNLVKIHHHGQRADNIVKGMLEHSRASSGVKELTDLNKLADEYLWMAYHGIRAKDKHFQVELTTRFSQEPALVNVIAQDIGRVMLNLYHNAFYAVKQKQKQAGSTYQPAVSVTTLVSKKSVAITIIDNGIGIPENIKNKIMQPFFTTKPTGEGTGLGLSISYDIVVKGHDGKIEVESDRTTGGATFTLTFLRVID